MEAGKVRSSGVSPEGPSHDEVSLSKSPDLGTDKALALLSKTPRPLTEAQQIKEVQEVYAEVFMAEKKCTEVGHQQMESTQDLSALQCQSPIYWHQPLPFELHSQMLRFDSARVFEVPSNTINYEGYQFFKADPIPGQKATWNLVERTRMHLNQSERYKMVLKKANKVSVAQQYQNLSPTRRAHVNQLIQEHKKLDPSMEWSCVYAKEHDRASKARNAHRADYETVSMNTILMKRPLNTKPGQMQAPKRTTPHLNDGDARIFEIPCQIAEHPANALGDYGAKTNFLRGSLAIRLRLPISRSSITRVTIGSGRQVVTVGTTTVPFKFRGEQTVHSLKFHLLSDCIHDIIIGKQFLKITQTFSNIANYARRVKERVIKGISQFHLLYLGAQTPMILGSINGQPQAALADSGSKILAMDETYARRIGVKISTGHRHQRKVIYANYSVAETVGMAYNVQWRFGHDDYFTSSHQLNFHILRNALANVILSDTFLFDTEACSKYQYLIMDDDEDCEDRETEIYFFAIDIDKRQKRLIENQQSYSLADLQHLELVRRGEEEDRIATLSGIDRTAAQAIEDKRLAEWNQEYEILKELSRSQRHQQNDAPVASQAPSTKLMQPRFVNLEVPKSSHRTKGYLPTLSNWLRRRSQVTGTEHELESGPGK